MGMHVMLCIEKSHWTILSFILESHAKEYLEQTVFTFDQRWIMM